MSARAGGEDGRCGEERQGEGLRADLGAERRGTREKEVETNSLLLTTDRFVTFLLKSLVKSDSLFPSSTHSASASSLSPAQLTRS